MIKKEKLQEYAKKLMFDMSDEEYKTLENEFIFLLEQMKKIESLEHIKEVEPMVFPFVNENTSLREDVIDEYLTVDEVLANTKHQLNDQVKVPKVVE